MSPSALLPLIALLSSPALAGGKGGNDTPTVEELAADNSAGWMWTAILWMAESVPGPNLDWSIDELEAETSDPDVIDQVWADLLDVLANDGEAAMKSSLGQLSTNCTGYGANGYEIMPCVWACRSRLKTGMRPPEFEVTLVIQYRVDDTVVDLPIKFEFGGQDLGIKALEPVLTE